MNFAEIQTAVQGNPALLTEIANGLGKDILPVISQNDELVKGIVPVLGQKGFIVRTQAEEQSYLNTYKTQVIADEIPGKIKEVHDKYDEDLFSLTGKRKNHSEKTYDFVKRVFNELKTSKIEDPVLKEQLTTLQTQLSELDTKHKREVSELETKYFGRELDMLVSTELSNINIALPAHLTSDEDKQKYINTQKSMMKRDMLSALTAKKDNEGNIVFYEGDKQLISTTDGKPLKPADIIKQKYGYYLAKDEGRKQGGAGSGGNGGGSTFTTKDQVYQSLEARGLKPLTKAFSDEYVKVCKENNINI